MANIKGLFTDYRQQIIASLSGTDHFIYRWYLNHIYRPKPNTVEEFLDRYSSKIKDFQAVQIGANDGITHDPIHKFIKRDRWNALLLEPQEWLVLNKLIPLYRNQPEVKIVNAALGQGNSQMEFHTIAFTKMRWATGLARFDKSTLLALFKDGTVDRRAKKYGLKMPNDPQSWIESKPVKTCSPQELIANNKLEKIDLLMVDTEGFDAEVVRMFLSCEIKPNAIVFEQFHLASDDRKRLLAQLSDKGYVHQVLGPNVIAITQELKSLL